MKHLLRTGRFFYVRYSINICNRRLYTPYSCSCRRCFRLRAPDQPRTYRHGCSSRIPHHRKSRWAYWECCPHCWRRHICARGNSRSWSHPLPSHFSHPHECCPCSRNHPYCRYSLQQNSLILSWFSLLLMITILVWEKPFKIILFYLSQKEKQS